MSDWNAQHSGVAATLAGLDMVSISLFDFDYIFGREDEVWAPQIESRL